MNILDLLVEKNLSNNCVYFITEGATGNILDIFYGKNPSNVWNAAVKYNRSNYVGEIKTSVYGDAERTGICIDEFNETTDTQYFEVE